MAFFHSERVFPDIGVVSWPLNSLLPPNSPETLENYKVTQKWLKSDFPGFPSKWLKSDSQLTFCPRKVSFESLLSHFWVTLRETPESHFLVTFEWLCNSPGFRGSWGAARITSQGLWFWPGAAPKAGFWEYLPRFPRTKQQTQSSHWIIFSFGPGNLLSSNFRDWPRQCAVFWWA